MSFFIMNFIKKKKKIKQKINLLIFYTFQIT